MCGGKKKKGGGVKEIKYMTQGGQVIHLNMNPKDKTNKATYYLNLNPLN